MPSYRRFNALALPVLLATALAAPLAAHAATPAPLAAPAPGVPGLGIANLDAVVTNSTAFKSAQQQRAVQFKAPIDQAEARRKQLLAQLQPLVDTFKKDRTAPNPDQASLQRQTQVIQNLQASGQAELNIILKPVALSEAYALEQINAQIPAAIRAAVTKNRISVLLGPQNVLLAGDANNLNPAILAELDALLPTVSIVPPAGWVPKAQKAE